MCSLLCENTVIGQLSMSQGELPSLDIGPAGTVILDFQSTELEKISCYRLASLWYLIMADQAGLRQQIVGAGDSHSRAVQTEVDTSCSFRPAAFQPYLVARK